MWLPENELARGEFAIFGATQPLSVPLWYSSYRSRQIAGRSELGASEGGIPEEAESPEDRVTFPEVYGFGPGAEAKPVGTATLVTDKGTLLEIVFFNMRTYQTVIGDGVAHDNKGNWYRVHVGTIDEEF